MRTVRDHSDPCCVHLSSFVQGSEQMQALSYTARTVPFGQPQRHRIAVTLRAEQRDGSGSTDNDGNKSLPSTSRRDLLKKGATLGFGGAAVRALRLLGVSELSQVPRGLTPLMTEMSKGAQLLQQVSSKMQPTVQHLLKMGMKPNDVLRMLENPALRPRNAAELQRWLR